MINNIQKKIGEKFYYGWWIILTAAVMVLFSSPGQTFSISAFIDSYILEFNYSRTEISSLYSVATIISGFLLVFMGKAVDRFGQKNMALIAGIMLAVACIFNSFNSNILMIFFGFFILRYFGQGSLSLIPGSLVPQWFEKKRALAISLYGFGLVAGNMLVPLMNVKLIETIGWNGAWRVWAILLILIFVPFIWMFVVNKPEDMGLLPDNRDSKNKENVADELKKIESESWTLNQALKTKEFWFISIITMVTPMITTGLMFHFFSIMESKSIGTSSAAFIMGLIALPGLIMPIISSLVIDRYKPRHILALVLFVMTGTLLYLIIVKSVLGAAIFMLVYGLISNIQNVTLGVIIPNYFGRKHLGAIRGTSTIFKVLGSALGAIPFAMSFDYTQSYNSSFILMASITFISMFLTFMIDKPEKKQEM